MKVRFRLIRNGKAIKEQFKEYDGPPEANKRQIDDDIYLGMDPGTATNPQGDWIEARVLDNPEEN